MSNLTTQPIGVHRRLQNEFPQIATLYRRMMNRHFATCADEYKEGASDSSVKRHDDEFRTAETELLTALLSSLSELAALRADKDRLDSGVIRLRVFDEWGDRWCIHSGLDLRAAIDSARAEEGGAK